MDDNGLLSQPISSAEKSEDMFNIRISNMMDGQTPQDSIDYINLLTYLLWYA